MATNPLVSLIIPTVNRAQEVASLLGSIEKLHYKNFEVVLVDQNGTDLLDEIVAESPLRDRITHIRIPSRGLSRAKNVGASHAQGDILSFPDDDAEFFPETVTRAVELLSSSGADVVFGKCVDRDLRDTVTKFSTREGFLTLNQHENMFVEATMFIRRDIFADYSFDESFGIGTFYGAEEGYDLVLRMLKGGVKPYYSPNVQFYHPSKILDYTSFNEIKRVFTYRCGFSHLCLKHALYGKLFDRMFKVSLYIPYLFIFNRKKVRYYFAEWLGIMTGICVR